MNLMHAIVKSLVKNFANLGGAFVGVPIAGDIVVDAWDYWHKDSDMQKMRAEIEAIARQSVQDALKEAQKVVATEAPTLPEAIRKQIVDYVSLVPASIRRSLRRSTDHTGLTVPHGMALRKANDLLPFLPAKLPHFKTGDRPLPHTDLELVELLGQGGFGEVWKARHVDSPNASLVALKFCLEPNAAKSLDNERMLLDHITKNGKIDGIVQLLYNHLRATPPCLEYELVEGGDLTSLITELHEKKKPDTNLVTRIVLQLTKILAHAHRQKPPIIHRDLKPANILVRRMDNKLSFKIADFGIGALAAKKVLLDYTTGKTKMAQQRRDTLLGTHTPFYASPEQVSGEFPDPRDDVHALGVIWFQLQTGNLTLMTMPPHWREDLLESGMSQEFVNILAVCIGRLKDRPSNAGDLARRVETLLPPPIGTFPPPPPEPVPTATLAPRVASSDLPPLPKDILALEGRLNGLRQTIDLIEQGKHPDVRAAWKAIEGQTTSTGQLLIESLKQRIEKTPSCRDSELCALATDAPQSALLVVINALKRLVELKHEHAEVKRNLHEQQMQDFRGILDRFLAQSKSAQTSQFPLGAWMKLEPHLVARRYAFARSARELLEQAEHCYAAICAEREAERLRLEREKEQARKQQEVERIRQEREREAERLRLEQEAERTRQQQEAERLRLEREREVERLRTETKNLLVKRWASTDGSILYGDKFVEFKSDGRVIRTYKPFFGLDQITNYSYQITVDGKVVFDLSANLKLVELAHDKLVLSWNETVVHYTPATPLWVYFILGLALCLASVACVFGMLSCCGLTPYK